ncbi:Recombination inhibitory protein MutS2 [Paucilactobacillus oligofermentans DSM 15707 = LMG 22743]|nr:endonuclease MutS2 [Paucilactobacillus oligofermentans]CUS26548.1 Recombination inhibitory protein MutS2 [Paucilactobacillus oligofermentans DSM 15707 = LMG 22743]
MNSKILEVMDFDKVKAKALPFLVSAAGKRELENLVPKTEIEKVKLAIQETTDGVNIYRLAGGMVIPQLADISMQLKRLKMDAVLNAGELAQITKILRTSMAVKDFFAKLREQDVDMHTIEHYVDDLVTIPTITKQLAISIEGDGHITDEASSKLHGLRQRITQTEGSIRSKMEGFTRGANAKYLSDAIITMRDDRYVIPVQANYRGKFGGIVHDQSGSGQTLFIEPQAVIELNNRLRQDQLDEKQEEIRILAELSALIAPYRIDIGNNEQILGHLDFINAKAQMAHNMRATLPIISNEHQINLKQARHPLIEANKTVANDIIIGDEYQMIVITGPNTGGKTITMKTLGLIQLMGQAGFYIPAQEESTIGVFEQIFADIGDEQSLEQNLSTFSSHISNIKAILDQADENSLVFLDEVGAGTDPKEGAALAMSILDALGAKSSYVLVTTHYPELKAYGFDREKTINASMEFDQETFKPTYKLLLGIPGQSNALEIAKRLGITESIIMESKALISEDSQDLNAIIGDLVTQRKLARDRSEQLENDLQATGKLQTDLDEKLTKFETQKAKLLEDAQVENNHLVSQSRKQADKIIERLRKLELEGQQIKENQLIDAKGELNSLRMDDQRLKKNKVLQREKLKHDLKAGDAVLVKSYGQYGDLIRKLGKQDWEVQLGILKMKVNESDLEKSKQANIAAQEREREPKQRITHSVSTRETSARLDLRGHRYDQAMVEVDQFIDHAVLSNLSSVTIVHGKGTGALRKGTQEYLRSNPRVKSFEFAAPNAGGDGATIVFL